MRCKNHKLPFQSCYHGFLNSRYIYLFKNQHQPYSPKMVPIAKKWASGSRTITTKYCHYAIILIVIIFKSYKKAPILSCMLDNYCDAVIADIDEI